MPALSALQVEMRVRRRWWVNHYVTMLILFCEIFDCEPNWQRVNWWLERGLKIEIRSRGRWRRIA